MKQIIFDFKKVVNLDLIRKVQAESFRSLKDSKTTKQRKQLQFSAFSAFQENPSSCAKTKEFQFEDFLTDRDLPTCQISL